MVDDSQIREVMTILGHRRWAGKSKAQKVAHAKMMVAARLRALARKRAEKKQNALR